MREGLLLSGGGLGLTGERLQEGLRLLGAASGFPSLMGGLSEGPVTVSPLGTPNGLLSGGAGRPLTNKTHQSDACKLRDICDFLCNIGIHDL